MCIFGCLLKAINSDESRKTHLEQTFLARNFMDTPTILTHAPCDTYRRLRETRRRSHEHDAARHCVYPRRKYRLHGPASYKDTSVAIPSLRPAPERYKRLRHRAQHQKRIAIVNYRCCSTHDEHQRTRTRKKIPSMQRRRREDLSKKKQIS